jgi:magnesium-protoporphyrin O-methyltransferase
MGLDGACADVEGTGDLCVGSSQEDTRDMRSITLGTGSSVTDFAQSGPEVETAYVVVMNRVICCYPDMPNLAGAAANRTKGLLVMSFPNRRWWTRLGLTVANLGFRVIRLQFRVFLHPPELIQAVVQQHGFRTRFNERGLLWQVNAFERIA